MVLEAGHQMAGQLHEVVLDHAHDMEPVRHDPGIGKVAAHEAAVGAGKVDTDDLDALPPLEFAEESGEIRFAFARPDIEDPAVPQIAEGGAEALAFVEGVLVDAEINRAVQREALGGLAAGELLIDPGDGGLPEFLPVGEGFGADAIVVLLVDACPERLGAVTAGQDAGKHWNE